MKIYDISVDTLNCEIYTGDPLPEAEALERIADGAECNVASLKMCVHTGTHMDAPLHFLEHGASIDAVPTEQCIGPCRVIEVPEGPITGEYVNRKFPRRCPRLLLKGGGKAWFMDSAAEEAAALGYKLIGTDALSVGTHGDQIKPHKAFSRRNIAILEGLDLSDVPPGDYFLLAAPVKLGGLEAAPVRALLIADYIFWSK